LLQIEQHLIGITYERATNFNMPIIEQKCKRETTYTGSSPSFKILSKRKV
jgi:hypothetical protein